MNGYCLKCTGIFKPHVCVGCPVIIYWLQSPKLNATEEKEK